MSYVLRLTGFRRAKDALNRVLRGVKPSGDLGRAIQFATEDARTYASKVTHVITGALRSAHRTQFFMNEPRGVVFIDPGVVNPFGDLPSRYGPIEEARGGTHAFYERTIREAGPEIGNRAMAYVKNRFP